MKKRRKYSSSHDRTLSSTENPKTLLIKIIHHCFYPPLFSSNIIFLFTIVSIHRSSFLFLLSFPSTIILIHHRFNLSSFLSIHYRCYLSSFASTILFIHHCFHPSSFPSFLFIIIFIHHYFYPSFPLSFHIHIHSQSFLSTILFIHHYFHPSFPFTILFIHHCFHPSSFLFTIISTYHRSFHPPPFSSFLSTIISTISLLIAQNPISTQQRY